MNKEQSSSEKKNSFESQSQNDRKTSNEDISKKQEGSMSYKNARGLPQNEKIDSQGIKVVSQDRNDHSIDESKSQGKKEANKAY